jgi:transposase-like protein
MAKKARKYSVEFKREAVRRMAEATTIGRKIRRHDDVDPKFETLRNRDNCSAFTLRL